jgi:predicted SAM-dependent methyltransferase
MEIGSNKFKKAFEEVIGHLSFEEFQSSLNLWQVLLKLFNPLKILIKDLVYIVALSKHSLLRPVYLWL